MKVNDFLVKYCNISKETARTLIQENRVQVNRKKAIQRQYLQPTDLVEMDGKVLQEPVVYKYYAFYKPRGIECTLNPGIKNNLRTIFPFSEHLYPVGRLDKDSEGLLLLTNDGKLCRDISASESLKEKEYEVEVEQELTDKAMEQLASGVVIMGTKTREAIVKRIHSHGFRIILTQGLNRQIRRMCHKLGYQVTSLKRVRITSVSLGNLKPGEYRALSGREIG